MSSSSPEENLGDYANHVSLGPLPRSMHQRLAKRAEEARHSGNWNDKLEALCLGGGPSFVEFLKLNGDVIRFYGWEDRHEVVDDGPEKVASIVCAARHMPELSNWLPNRPSSAKDCSHCAGNGWWTFPGTTHTYVCLKCSGLGWIVRAAADPQS